MGLRAKSPQPCMPDLPNVRRSSSVRDISSNLTLTPSTVSSSGGTTTEGWRAAMKALMRRSCSAFHSWLVNPLDCGRSSAPWRRTPRTTYGTLSMKRRLPSLGRGAATTPPARALLLQPGTKRWVFMIACFMPSEVSSSLPMETSSPLSVRNLMLTFHFLALAHPQWISHLVGSKYTPEAPASSPALATLCWQSLHRQRTTWRFRSNSPARSLHHTASFSRPIPPAAPFSSSAATTAICLSISWSVSSCGTPHMANRPSSFISQYHWSLSPRASATSTRTRRHRLHASRSHCTHVSLPARVKCGSSKLMSAGAGSPSHHSTRSAARTTVRRSAPGPRSRTCRAGAPGRSTQSAMTALHLSSPLPSSARRTSASSRPTTSVAALAYTPPLRCCACPAVAGASVCGCLPKRWRPFPNLALPFLPRRSHTLCRPPRLGGRLPPPPPRLPRKLGTEMRLPTR
mmetsp:Transcript_23649/g.80641  ORF Transcript_23649/g.80641 Transcript_23649/m.80641 type:complete len:458 (+) Transcript_23649:1013-2386(+)